MAEKQLFSDYQITITNKKYKKMENISIIICVYNEAKTIENVVVRCREYNPNSEIIVVDDGSTDGSTEILTRLSNSISLKHISLPENKGKSNAMVVGVENAKNEIILFFDADISDVNEVHFKQLLSPVIGKNPEADMVLGIPSETLIDYRVNPFKSLTGERALIKKDIEPILENIRNIRFGVETYINLYYQSQGKRIKYTLLDGLVHPTKYNKTTPIKATQEFISEGQEIALTLLRNNNLVIKVLYNSLDKRGKNIKKSVKKLQDDFYDKLSVLVKNE
jgi:glycosyltransferase involved in cell wall biosynthesis